MKITKHPILQFEKRDMVHFTMDGLDLYGFEGEPVASALMANGIHVMRHTHKNGEPRGIFCGIGQCCECMLMVDGKPNVRSCITPLRAEMQICTQEGHAQIGVSVGEPTQTGR